MESLHHRWQLLLVAVLFCLCNVESKPSQVERIINGENAKPKQFPYQVFYDIEVTKQWKQTCGGTIIGKKTILTAAHCLDGRSGEIQRIKIYLGAVDKSNSTETGQQIVIVEAGSYVIHEDWDINKKSNDIALIKLPTDLEFNQYIQPAELPKPNSLHVDKNAIVSGWGRVKGFVRTEHLQYTNVITLSNEECQSLLREKKFYSHWLCIAPGETTTCSGDSGGPLAERNPDGSGTVIGIVSFGFGRCDSKFPAVFTRVAYFLNWIAQHINES
ncbi:PREDICTED: chymotrypsin-like [Drosophila arizonae]|uniref:Chymotrypsin-like n=1 Tax=Drosophila arizonae TaxID=7263 RepID=A0ABM1P0E2_DROAR|nr:PREDICTED: chymotrypsin-like [Drosophila arizonae]